MILPGLGLMMPRPEQRASAPYLGSPGNLVATPGDEEVVLTWTAAGGASSQQPQYRETGGEEWSSFGEALGGTAVTVTVTSLVNDTGYDFRISATDGVSTTYSNTATGTPEAAGVEPFDSFDFDAMTTGQKPSNGTYVTWGSQTPSAPFQVSEDIARSGTKSLKFPVNGDNNEGNFTLGQDLSEVWLEYYLYHPDGTEGISGIAEYQHGADGSSENDKFFRLWGEEYTDRGKVGLSSNPLADTDDSNIFFEYSLANAGMSNNGLGGVDFITDARRGEWIRIRLHFRKNSGASDGIMRLWIDDSLVLDHENLNASLGSYAYWDRGYFFGSDNSGSPNTSAIYLDDLKLYDADPGWVGA